MKQKKNEKAGKIALSLLVGIAVITALILVKSNATAQNGTTASQSAPVAAPTQPTTSTTKANTADAPSTAPVAETSTAPTAPVEAPAAATTPQTAESTSSTPLNLPPESSAQPVVSEPSSLPVTDTTDAGQGNRASASTAKSDSNSNDVGGVGVNDYYAPKGVESADDQARLPVLFNLNFQTIYDDNIYITRDNRKSDLINRITPQILFETTRLEKWERRRVQSKRSTTTVGEDEPVSSADEEETQPENYLRALYAPTYQKYTTNYTNDALDHNAQILYRHKTERSILEVGQTFTTYNGPNIDVKGTLQSTNYGSRIFGTYAVTGKSTLELEALQNLNRYESGRVNNDEWIFTPYYNYEISPKVTLGLGTIVDILHIAGGVNQTGLQPNLRAIYKYSEKLSFTTRFGVEVREFDGYNYQKVSPQFGLGAKWQPFEHTSLQLDGYRRTSPSIGSANQDYDSTGTAFTVRQDFLKKYFASLRTSYEYSTYFFSTNGTSAGRSQDYYTIRPTIGYIPNDFLTFSVYYQFSQNVSPQPSNEFTDNQIGFQGSFSY